MNTSYPWDFEASNILSMFSTVLFSVTLAPTAPQFAPLSLSTSFCGSMNTTAVSLLRMSTVRYFLREFLDCRVGVRGPEIESKGVRALVVGDSGSPSPLPCEAPGRRSSIRHRRRELNDAARPH